MEQIYSPYTRHIQHHTCVHKALPVQFSTGSKQGRRNNERGVWSASPALTNSTKERQASVCVFPACRGSLGMCVCDKSPVSLQFTHCPNPAGTVMPPASSAYPAPGATLQDNTELVFWHHSYVFSVSKCALLCWFSFLTTKTDKEMSLQLNSPLPHKFM